jgi:hypothetical protein
VKDRVLGEWEAQENLMHPMARGKEMTGYGNNTETL